MAIVTGAGSGLGKDAAEELARYGVKVVAADINLEAAEKTAKIITDASGEAVAFKMDASTREDNEGAVKKAVETYGALHLALNSAGIDGPGARIGEMDLDKWDRTVQLNLNGVVYGMHYQIKQFLTQDDPSRCAIVNMTSVHGHVAILENAAYTATKHGLLGVTKNAAAEYGEEGIRVNAVSRHTSRPRCRTRCRRKCRSSWPRSTCSAAPACRLRCLPQSATSSLRKRRSSRALTCSSTAATPPSRAVRNGARCAIGQAKVSNSATMAAVYPTQTKPLPRRWKGPALVGLSED